MYYQKEHRLVYQYNDEKVFVEAWGKDGIRVRITKKSALRGDRYSALLPAEPMKGEIVIEDQEQASLKNGRIKAVFNHHVLTFYNEKGEELIGESWRGAPLGQAASFVPFAAPDPVIFGSRRWRYEGAAWRVQYRFKAYEGEKIFGMGQHTEELFDRKGCTLELAPRNKQASIPFYVSSRGYGFLWNNPAIGRVSFGSNYTEWEAELTDELDFWITAGDTPKEIERQYAMVSGTVPMMPDFAMGFWQCKLRYVTQEELLTVAREYYRRKIPVKVIIIDFCHWTKHGNWFLDPEFWPDPKAMVEELNSMGMEVVASVWPSVEMQSDNYKEMTERGLMVRNTHGQHNGEQGILTFVDVTNPDAREYLWEKIRKNYYSYGIRNFWLDCAEPEYSKPDFEQYMYDAGPAELSGNLYPLEYAKTFYDGLRAEGEEAPVSLIRCAWAGSQRYGALLWSGDIYSDWETLRQQIHLGQNVAMSGLPWWNTDIGGFMGGVSADPDFRELLIRWFQWGTFCPVMRLHGIRTGEAKEGFTPDNEIWSYGDENDKIMEAHIRLRDKMLPYIRKCMQEAHEYGDPVIRPMFYEFPDDAKTWNLPYQYMFGSDLLVAPVLEKGARSVEAYLPTGEDWIDIRDGKEYKGGQNVMLPAPIESIPVLRKKSAQPMF